MASGTYTELIFPCVQRLSPIQMITSWFGVTNMTQRRSPNSYLRLVENHRAPHHPRQESVYQSVICRAGRVRLVAIIQRRRPSQTREGMYHSFSIHIYCMYYVRYNIMFQLIVHTLGDIICRRRLGSLQPSLIFIDSVTSQLFRLLRLMCSRVVYWLLTVLRGSTAAARDTCESHVYYCE